MNKFLKIALMVALATSTTVGLNGCTNNYDSENRRIADEGTTFQTTYGIIISSNPVKIKEENLDKGTTSAVAAIGGAVAGSLIGYNSSHHHSRSYKWHHGGHTGSDVGGIIGGLLGLGAGLLIGNLISNSANTVDGLRVNIVTFDDQNFTIDVPKDSRFVSGSYVQINVTGNGYTQLTPITKEAYELVVKQQNAVRAGKYDVNDQQYYDDNNYSQQNSSSRNSSRSNLNDSDLYLD